MIPASLRERLTPEVFKAYRQEFLGMKQRTKAQTTDPVPPGEVEPKMAIASDTPKKATRWNGFPTMNRLVRNGL